MAAEAPTGSLHERGDRLVRGVLAEGAFRFVGARLTDTVFEAIRIHRLAAAPAHVLGEALISTALLAPPMKTDEKCSLSLTAHGRMRSLHADCNHEGDLRGYLRLAEADDQLPARGLSSRDLMAPPGVLRVSRSLPGRVTYHAVTELRLGAIGADLALHLSTSDQIETEIRTYQALEAAGGLLVQAMPGADLDRFVAIRAALGTEDPGPPGTLVDRPEELVRGLLGGFEPRILEVSPVRLKCNCSRERVAGIFRQLTPEELLELTEPDGTAYAHCHWCNSYYYFSAKEMTAFLQARSRGGTLPS